jgi:hypothetical protein
MWEKTSYPADRPKAMLPQIQLRFSGDLTFLTKLNILQEKEFTAQHLKYRFSLSTFPYPTFETLNPKGNIKEPPYEQRALVVLG